MPNDFDAVNAQNLRTAHGIDDEVPHVHDTQEGVHTRRINVIDGAQVIPIMKPLVILGYRCIQRNKVINHYSRIASASNFGTRMVRLHCIWLRAMQILNLPE